MKPEHRAISFFFPDHKIRQLTSIGSGNINDTWRVRLSSGTTFILQRLSPDVFPDPALVMTNLERVTTHLQLTQQNRHDCSIQLGRPVRNPAGRISFVDRRGHHWRMLTYIKDSRTLTVLESAAQAGEIGRLLGCFHQQLSTLDPADLHEPLPGFHITSQYLKSYDHARQTRTQSADAREQTCFTLIERFRDQADILERHQNTLRSGIIHGDPKVANFLFADNTDTAISLIDLDTVMPGLLLYDLGDCLRSCCNPAGEEIEEPEKISFNEKLFTAVMEGYCCQAPDLMGRKDQKLLIDAVWLITFELGLRFFTDHLTGNQYFNVQRPDQNLHRALVQLHLALSILRQQSRLDLLWQRIMMGRN